MHADVELRVVAQRQHGLVALEHARRLLTRWQLQRRLASPDWELTSPRVMRLVGAPISDEQPIMVAVLDGGPGTAASYTGAGPLWRLPGLAPGPLEVSRERGVSGRRPAVGHLHEPRYLPSHHVTVVRGVAVTTLPRTIFDLAGRFHPARTERIMASVIGKAPGTLRVLHRLLPELAEHGRNGIVVMRDLLQKYPIGCIVEETGLERRVNHIVADAGLQRLEPQVSVGGHAFIGRVDFRDPIAPAVLYEVDSLLHHSSPLDLLLDAERDAALYGAGFRRVVRIPEEHVWYEPWNVVAAVASVQRGAAPAAA